MIIMPNLGFGRDIVDEKKPGSRFLVHTDRTSFENLVAASVLPYFSTNLVMHDYMQPADHIFVPITDPEVNVTFYFIAKEKDRKKFARIFPGRSVHIVVFLLVCRFTGFDQTVKIGKCIFDRFAVI